MNLTKNKPKTPDALIDTAIVNICRKNAENIFQTQDE